MTLYKIILIFQEKYGTMTRKHYASARMIIRKGVHHEKNLLRFSFDLRNLRAHGM